MLDARLIDFLEAPCQCGCPSSVDRHDEVDAVPKVVDVGTTELGVGGESRQSVRHGPLVAEGAEVHLLVTVSESVWPEAPGASDGSRTTCPGQGKPPLGGVKVRSVVEGEQGLMAEGRPGGAVEQG